jgi:hypothetical protein
MHMRQGGSKNTTTRKVTTASRRRAGTGATVLLAAGRGHVSKWELHEQGTHEEDEWERLEMAAGEHGC